MDGLEYILVLDVQRRQLVDVKETPPIDLVISHTPEGEAIMLPLEEVGDAVSPFSRMWTIGVEPIQHYLIDTWSREREHVIVVLDRHASARLSAIARREIAFAILQNLPQGTAEDGDEHLVPETPCIRCPVDVEVMGETA